MLGFIELSLVKNLNKLDYQKHKMSEMSEKHIEKVKESEKTKQA